MSGGWIAVDLDGTLAEYKGWRGADHVGAPIRRMRLRVVGWLNGRHPSGSTDVRIFTARTEESYPAIERWCIRQFGRKLPITNVKDFAMIELWDDRAVQVELNTGRRADGLE
jgi:hypothetical protein